MLTMPRELSKEKVLIGFVFFDLFIIGFLATVLFLNPNFFSKSAKESNLPQKNLIMEAEPIDIAEEEGVFNAVLLGSGGPGHSGGGLTDSIIVAHVNTTTKKAALISVPRDLWVPGGTKLNAVAAAIGIENVASTVQNVTGLDIDYYISVNFDEFVKIIDALGGIEVDVPNSFQDNFYPIKGEENNLCGFTEEEVFVFKNKFTGFELEKQFTCRYEQLKFEKGPTELDGNTALKFVRSRHGDSDFGRSQRQFAVLKGALAKLISLEALNNSSTILNGLYNLVKTDTPAGVIKSFLEVVGDTSLYEITQIQLTTDNVLNESKSTDGQYILVPKSGNYNFTEVQNFVKQKLK